MIPVPPDDTAELAEFAAAAARYVAEVQAIKEDLERSAAELRERRTPETVDAAAALAAHAERLASRLDALDAQRREWERRAARAHHRQRAGFSIIRAQEEERRRLARDIHDGPAQLLANVVFRIEVSQKLLSIDRDRALAELEQLKTLVRHSLQDVRKIIFDLRPMALDDLGLIPALRGYLSTFGERTGLATDLIVQGTERRVPPAVEVAAFRIAQEALSNAWKHGDATRATVTVRFEPGQLSVAIEDDGAGFNVAEALQRQGGFGLLSMRERAGLVGGSLDIVSAPGEGTTVLAVIPLQAEGDGWA
ncbi:MAG: sensor histidine kinase [Clostridia bacterium]|nr:sensor histidine kinase [Clostridia bacterium]